MYKLNINGLVERPIGHVPCWQKMRGFMWTFVISVATLPWESVKMKLTFPKWGLGSPLRLLKFQSSIARVRTPHIGVLFISLESYQSVDVRMASHGPFGHLQHKLWQKKGLGIKLIIWLPTIKSRESTQPRCVQVECNTPLESSRRKIQVYFRPHLNWRSEQGVMTLQSPGSLNRDNFRAPPWESWDKKPFGCRCHGEM